MEAKPRNVEVYVAPNGKCPFDDWLGALRDKIGKSAIENRINRVRRGLPGDADTVGDGIIELIIESGPGYRVYCADYGESFTILCDGMKRNQQSDIDRAKAYWSEYRS